MSKVIMSVEIKGGVQEMTLYIHLILYPLWVGMFQVCPGWQSVPEMLYAMCNWAAIGEVNSDDKHYNCDHHYLIYHSSLLQDEYKEGQVMIMLQGFLGKFNLCPWLATGKGTYSVISCAFQWWQGDTGLNTDWHILLKSAALEGVLMTCQHLGSQWSWWRTASYWHVAVRKELDEWSFVERVYQRGMGCNSGIA